MKFFQLSVQTVEHFHFTQEKKVKWFIFFKDLKAMNSSNPNIINVW